MSKEKVSELVTRIREAAKLQDPVAQAAIDMVRLVYEASKDMLVDVAGDDMLRAQGSARTLDKLHRDLTRTPPNISENNA